MLRRVLEPLRQAYDYILIRFCNPSLGLLLTNVLVASDKVIIPVQTQFFTQGLSVLESVIRNVRMTLNPGLEIAGVLFTSGIVHRYRRPTESLSGTAWARYSRRKFPLPGSHQLDDDGSPPRVTSAGNTRRWRTN